jgi:hypothetical protein
MDPDPEEQCCGAGSDGSICFWGLMDPDPLVRGTDPDSDLSSSKYRIKKNLDSYCYVTFL